MDKQYQGECQDVKRNYVDQIFENFVNADTLENILSAHKSLCDALNLIPSNIPEFYPKLKANLTSWKAKALWKKLDQRANSKCYNKGKICSNNKVLITGAGPCGLRAAIEAQLLGAKVVIVEKRNRFSRNNVIHLWRWVIEDLKMLCAKRFYGKFCAGSIDHISIRKLQCILLKIALLLGVELHINVTFENIIEPNAEENLGWRAEFIPQDHPLSKYEFDVIFGADGKKRNTLSGFRRKEFRGKLAIAITANFVNNKTEAETKVEEISGVNAIYRPDFFKDLYTQTGIDLENIVYYKDDTHYFIMTAKKHSLLSKGVIRQDVADITKLLAWDNVDKDALMGYAKEAAEFSTHNELPNLNFAKNHYDEPDVAVFDFTCMYHADNASRITERHGYKLLAVLVGDSLMEPFWPLGSGCAKGFLSSLDASWAMRGWGSGQMTPLEILTERESIYRLLPATTQDSMQQNFKSYTLDPATRYRNLNKHLVPTDQLLSLYETDQPEQIDVVNKRRKLDAEDKHNKVFEWVREKLKDYEEIEINDISFLNDGKVLCAIIKYFRSDLLDYNDNHLVDASNNLAYNLLETELDINPVTNEEVALYENALNFLYLIKIYDKYGTEEVRTKVSHAEKNIEITPELLINTRHNLNSHTNHTNKPASLLSETDPSCKEFLTKTNDLRAKFFKSLKERSYINFNNGQLMELGARNENNTINLQNEDCVAYFTGKKHEKKRVASYKDFETFNNKYLQRLRILKKIMRRYYDGREKLKTIMKAEIKSRLNCNSDLLNVSCKLDDSGIVASKESLQVSNKTTIKNGCLSKEERCIQSRASVREKVSSMNATNGIKLKTQDIKESTRSIITIYKNNDDVFDASETPIKSSVDVVEANNTAAINSKIVQLENEIPKREESLEIKTNETSQRVTIYQCNKNQLPDIYIQSVEEINSKSQSVYVTEIKYWTKLDRVHIQPKILDKRSNLHSKKTHDNNNTNKRQKFADINKLKVSSLCAMTETKLVPPDRTFDRVHNWLKHSDFKCTTECSLLAQDKNDIAIETNLQDKLTDITSITKEIEGKLGNCKGNNVADANVIKADIGQVKSDSCDSINALKNNLKAQKSTVKYFNATPWEMYEDRVKSRSEPMQLFTTIIENEEIETPEGIKKKSSTKLVCKPTKPIEEKKRKSCPFHYYDRCRHHHMKGAPILRECKCKRRKSVENLGLFPVSFGYVNTIVFTILLYVDYKFLNIIWCAALIFFCWKILHK